jgi:hypothetical protein
LALAFYLKCRPQGADVLQLVHDYKRVFIGYPPWREGVQRDRTRIRSCMLDLADWDSSGLSTSFNRGYTSRVTANRNLVESVRNAGPGSLCVIPRPGEGVVYLCKVKGFELVDNPAWGDAYLDVRRDRPVEGSEAWEVGHIGDVVQTWEIEGEVKSVPFTFIPRWITYQLLSRTSSGVIWGRPGESDVEGRTSAYEALLAMYKSGAPRFDLSPTSSPEEVERRLMDWISPSSFEHLVIELLQLEAAPGRRWWHIGGSGDGGADGLCSDGYGVVEALQCKWKWDGDPVELGRAMLKERKDGTARVNQAVVAVLFGKKSDRKVDAVRVLDRADIAKLLIEHRARCASALALGVSDL